MEVPVDTRIFLNFLLQNFINSKFLISELGILTNFFWTFESSNAPSILNTDEKKTILFFCESIQNNMIM